MKIFSAGRRILNELRRRKALRLNNSLALDDYSDLAGEIQRRLPEGVSRANPSGQVATLLDSLDYFKTAPPHEQKIALMRLHGVPDSEIAGHLRMSAPVFKAVSNQMLAKFAAHRGDKPGGGLHVPAQQSTGVARRELRAPH
jgi:hypothetical protein